MMRTPVRFVRLAVPLLLALGCAPQVTAPRLPAGTASSETMLGVHVERLAEVSAIGAMAQNETRRESFVPLAPGNRWNYVHVYRSVYTTSAGAETLERSVVDVSGTVCPFHEPTGDRDYVGYLNTGYGLGQWSIERQDASGLWAAGGGDTFICPDAPAAVPASAQAPPRPTRGHVAERLALERAVNEAFAGGLRSRASRPAESFETLVLKYPLHVGQSWNPRENVRVTVVAFERVPTGAGPQMAYELDHAVTTPFGTSHSFSWYGRIGLIATFSEASGIVKDDSGHPIGSFHVTDRAILTRHWVGPPDGPFLP